MKSHGLSGTVEYDAYVNAQQRCRRKDNPRYGGRGIKFLFTSFGQFLAEVGTKPSADCLLDRIDNDGHYEPGNLRWSTPKESALNRKQTTGNKRPDLAERNRKGLSLVTRKKISLAKLGRKRNAA